MSEMGNNNNFDLLIMREGDNYRVRADSPAGEYTDTFSAPFTAEQLNEFLHKLNPISRYEGEFIEAIKDFGGQLFATIFKGQIHTLLGISRAMTKDKCLRIRLNLTAVPELADLPWEYLYDADLNSFLALSESTPIVRYLDMPAAVPPLTVGKTLSVLVMISNASDQPPLAVEEEWERLNESLKELLDLGLVKLKRVRATESELRDRLQKGTFHIFHFIGHGDFDQKTGRGYLIMEDEEGNGFPFSGEELGIMLHDYKFRLVVLNSCEGARTSLTDSFAGTAQRILQAGVSAVIAMQFQISDDISLDFAKVFYKELAGHRPVDAALTSARQAIKGKGDNVEWATPALYLRPDDGRIFEKSVREGKIEPNELHYGEIIKWLREGKVIPILGPSVNRCGRLVNESYGPGRCPPDYSEIAEYLAHNSGQGESQDLARISQCVATLGSLETLDSKLQSLLNNDYEPTPLHHLLASLPGILSRKGHAPPYQLIVTSNYDNALEQAFHQRGEEYDMIHCEADGGFYHTPFGKPARPITKRIYDELSLKQRALILKLHGAVCRDESGQRSYVIMEDHYIDYLSNNESLLKRIRGVLRDSHFLFLGYRMRDWNLRVIFHRLWKDARISRDSWVVQPDPDPVDRSFWNKRNVHPLDVSLIDFVEEIRARLERL